LQNPHIFDGRHHNVFEYTETLIDIHQAHLFLLYMQLHVSTFLTVIIRPSNRSSQQMLCTFWYPNLFTLIKNLCNWLARFYIFYQC